MAHVPHVFAAGPWESPTLVLDERAAHHLRTVLRRGEGQPVSYTDGAGRIGSGVLTGQAIRRGDEWTVPRPSGPAIAVAPPDSKDRARFLVEKLAELGVGRLIWLRTVFGQGRPPSGDKVAAWTRAALEQSRSAWLTQVDERSLPVDALPVGTVYADVGGDPDLPPNGVSCVAVGPEGGWGPDELPADAIRVSLGRSVLRVETAAIVAAVRTHVP